MMRKQQHLWLMLALITAMISPQLATAKTKRTANVVVKNNTGFDLVYVGVGHKYSNVYNEPLQWKGVLKNGHSTSAKKVTFNTGALTTGKDWWLVQWVPLHDNIVFYTNPANFRQQIDALEKQALPMAISAVPAIAGAICTGATAGGCGAPTVAAVSVTVGLTQKFLPDLVKGTTAGFKQHILRKGDAGKTVTITLHPHIMNGSQNTVTISSPTGKSTTQYAGRYPKISDKSYKKIVKATKKEIKKLGFKPNLESKAREKMCYNLVQGKVSWSKSDRKKVNWGPANVNKLCKDVVRPVKMIACFNNRLYSGKGWEQSIKICQEKHAEFRQGFDDDSAVAAREKQCYNLVQGKVAWNLKGAKSWMPDNVKKLCKGVTSPTSRVSCFKNRIKSNYGWSKAIKSCSRT